MALKYLCCEFDKISTTIDRKSESNSKIIEQALLDDNKTQSLLKFTLETIQAALGENNNLEFFIADRKAFERKETTSIIIDYIKRHSSIKDKVKDLLY